MTLLACIAMACSGAEAPRRGALAARWREPITGMEFVLIPAGTFINGDSCRCALRYTHAPKDRGWSLGFRLVREVDPPQ